jgi:hypothetical protein
MAVLSYNILGNYLNPAVGNVSLSSSSTAFTISLTADSGFTDALSVPYVGGYVFSTIYVKFVPIEVTDYTGNISHIAGNLSKTLLVSGSVFLPSLVVSPSAIGFGQVLTGTTAVEQFYSLSGSHLFPESGNISIIAPSGFEISLTSATDFSSSTLIPYNNLVLTSTLIYVRFIPMLEQSYSGNIINLCGGVTTNVSVTGDGVSSVPVAGLNIVSAISPQQGDISSWLPNLWWDSSTWNTTGETMSLGYTFIVNNVDVSSVSSVSWSSNSASDVSINSSGVATKLKYYDYFYFNPVTIAVYSNVNTSYSATASIDHSYPM